MTSSTAPTDENQNVEQTAPQERSEAPSAPSAPPAPSAARSEPERGGYGDRGPRPRYRDRDDRGDRGRGGDRRGGGRRPRRRVCAFCVDKITKIDYKEHQRLRDFVSDRGKILKSRMTGTCMKHQRALGRAIKRARQVALLPFVSD
jgi:small subunit ribosomal protein S18